ncbi:MAG: hypothetical protein ABF645_02530, partial [Lentilactobacillus hilgardii]
KTLHAAFPKKINKVDIGIIPVLLPSEAEQQKEGLCLEYFDKIIAANLRQRLNNLLNIENYLKVSIHA